MVDDYGSNVPAGLKESVRFRVSALERFCYKKFLRNSSWTKIFFRLREVYALEDVALGRFHRPRFSQLTMTPDLLWIGRNIYISSVMFVKDTILMNVFNSPYFCHQYSNSCWFLYFIFCFSLCYLIVDIVVNHLYVLFLRGTNTKCSNKKEKNHSNVILA